VGCHEAGPAGRLLLHRTDRKELSLPDGVDEPRCLRLLRMGLHPPLPPAHGRVQVEQGRDGRDPPEDCPSYRYKPGRGRGRGFAHHVHRVYPAVINSHLPDEL